LYVYVWCAILIDRFIIFFQYLSAGQQKFNILQEEPELKKEPEEYALEYAGFWIRLGASIIDIIFILLILYTIYYIVSGFSVQTVSTTLSIPSVGLTSWLINLVYLLGLSLVYIIGFWLWRGQTPGKMIVGIKVIRTDSSPITWQYACRRYLGYIASTLILCIGFIIIAFDKRKQGLHDRIADTYVVKLPVRQVELAESYAGGSVG